MAARSRHTCSTLTPRRSASVFAERSAIAVRTQPGSTALDVTPNGPASWATARASPITPCLEAVLAHAAYRQPREFERTVEVDAHRLAPDLGILLPQELLVGRADAVVHDE